ncbi:hypothetical protein ACGFNU_25715 [Spirillospora sp. NPDC048911]|uniref:hypothetical protein n=1 Tax=Spirillospora sp. NPDC048911 TaxID=3364527 RepID=UPI0037154985
MRRVPFTHGSAGVSLSSSAAVSVAAAIAAAALAPVATAESQAAGSLAAEPLTSADLRIGLTGPAHRVKAGGIVDYTVSLRNAGPAAVRDATTKVRLPRGIAVIQISDSGCRERGRILSCRPAALAAGASRTIHILGIVKPSARGSYRARARVYARGAADPVLRNNMARAVTKIAPSTDMAVRLSAPRRAAANGKIMLAVTVVNRGPRPARHVILNLGAHGARLTAPSPRWNGGCQVTVTNERTGGHFLRCSLGRLAVGARRTVYVPARSASARRVRVQEYAVTAWQRLGERRPANNTATVKVRVARAS